MRKPQSFGEWLVNDLLCAVVAIGLIIVFGAPVLAGIWLYSAMHMPLIVLAIGGVIYVALAVLVLMYLSWASRLWPEPLRNAFNKVLLGPWYFTF